MSVSILIPAFRPTFLRQTIASALAQGLEDFELIISDDSGGDELLPIVDRFRDPRITYVRTAGRTGASANCQTLWDRAGRDRVLFLLDDDLLMPHALPELSAQLDEHPHAAYSFGQRYTIDDKGKIRFDAIRLAKSPMVIERGLLVRSILAKLANPVGEMNNVLVNRKAGSTIEDLRFYQGFEMRMMGDVAFFINASRRGPVVAINAAVASYRQHDTQLSARGHNPQWFIQVGEWELFLRGEFSAGALAQADAQAGVEKLREVHKKWAPQCPQLETLAAGLDPLADAVARNDRDVLTDAFRATLDGFVAAFPSSSA